MAVQDRYMRFSRTDLLQMKNQHLSFDEEIVFDEETLKPFSRIRKLRDVRAVGEGEYNAQQQRLYLNLKVSGVMTCPCDVTGEDVEVPFDSVADEIISFDKSDADNIEILKPENGVIEMLSVIFRQILVEVPIKVRKPGSIEYPKGDGWEVMSEEAYQKEKQSRVDPRLAALKDYIPQDE
mgnify:CR=1 FL=1